jgi:hypothetical protein
MRDEFLKTLEDYIDKYVSESIAKREKAFIAYIVESENKISNILQQFDKYMTVNGELKDGKSVRRANNEE